MPATEGLRNEPNKFFVINSTGEHIDEPSRFWGVLPNTQAINAFGLN